MHFSMILETSSIKYSFLNGHQLLQFLHLLFFQSEYLFLPFRLLQNPTYCGTGGRSFPRLERQRHRLAYKYYVLMPWGDDSAAAMIKPDRNEVKFLFFRFRIPFQRLFLLHLLDKSDNWFEVICSIILAAATALLGSFSDDYSYQNRISNISILSWISNFNDLLYNGGCPFQLIEEPTAWYEH